MLFLAGLPPYGPGDLIDVDIDEDGAVWISMADHFARPLRLTRQEALAVYVRATELAATPGMPGAPALDGRARRSSGRRSDPRRSGMRPASRRPRRARRRRIWTTVRAAAEAHDAS